MTLIAIKDKDNILRFIERTEYMRMRNINKMPLFYKVKNYLRNRKLNKTTTLLNAAKLK